MSDEVSWFARQYIDYVYVPGFLLVLGTAVVKWDWVIYAVPLALVLGAYNVWSFRKFLSCSHSEVCDHFHLSSQLVSQALFLLVNEE